tara:strand:- start:57365 stop:58315 length:951 start_codon:yes stop_codon:yes gene_type:complete
VKKLYPPIKPFNQHKIEVDSPHKLYIEECGDPDGLPVLFVHGGPGAGCTEDDRRFFDPMRYRIILFDQRGCGRSKPHGSLENNDTQALIRDMETIRESLGLQRWMLFGGSWGSTLSLLYAQAHPERVMGMIMRGIFLCREEDFKWFYQEGASQIFPDYWEEFMLPISETKRIDVISAYYKLLNSNDELARMGAAKHWAQWEGQCATLHPCKTVFNRFTHPHTAMSLARIEAHYFLNKSFIEPNQILQNMHKLENIPGIIVHGRYDMICPLDNAYKLHHAWERSELHIIRDAGHASSEPGTTDALVNATNIMARYHE